MRSRDPTRRPRRPSVATSTRSSTHCAADRLIVRTDKARDGVAPAELRTPYVVPRFEKFGTLERLMIAGE